jgi:hypothetical protein
VELQTFKNSKILAPKLDRRWTVKEKDVAGMLTGNCQEKKFESTTLIVSADNDGSLILGEEDD